MGSSAPIGVGILGAGPVTQAIHLPTLARMPERFTVRAVMDVDPAVAASVAGRVGARPATTVAEVLDDSAVQVVAICSPHQFHARQVEAACAAGKIGILCEKPLAMSRGEVEAISAAVRSAGTPLVVGAMHVYDPGWRAALEHVGELGAVHTIRSTIVLPPNPRFEDWATQSSGPAARPAERARTPGGDDAATLAAERVRGMVMGLWVHDLPLVRTLAPRLHAVEHAAAVLPYGGTISLTAGGTAVDLLALMRPLWRPQWSLQAWGPKHHLRVDFTPSYIHAGSAAATLISTGASRTWGPYPRNGYEQEWIELHEQVAGGEPVHPLDAAVDDLAFTVAIADAAAQLISGATPVGATA